METLPIEIAVEFIVPHVVDIKSIHRLNITYTEVVQFRIFRTLSRTSKKRSPLYNYCLVSKLFNYIFTYYHREWLISHGMKHLVCKIPLNFYMMNRFIDFYENREPRLWVQSKRTEEVFAWKLPVREQYEAIVTPWIIIKCKNKAERFIIHSMARAVGFCHMTIEDIKLYHDEEAHRYEYEEYLRKKGSRAKKNKHYCVNAEECMVFRDWKSGVLVSSVKLRLPNLIDSISEKILDEIFPK